MSKTTKEQSELLSEMMIFTELWLSTWSKLISTGYQPRHEIVSTAKRFKSTLEGLQKQAFNTAKMTMTKEDYKKFELDYMNRVSALESLITAFNEGKVAVTND